MTRKISPEQLDKLIQEVSAYTKTAKTRCSIQYSMRDGDLPKQLENIGAELEQSFVESFTEIIDLKGLRDPAVYKAAGIDRRLFSKITTDPFYRPSKDTCVALALALELNIDEANSFLARAGYTLSHSIKRDLILKYFFKTGFYDVNTVNLVLEQLEEKPLGR